MFLYARSRLKFAMCGDGCVDVSLQFKKICLELI